MVVTKISDELKRFFAVEIRNEEFGGVSPARVSSALDSWLQAPDYVRMSWITTKGEPRVNKKQLASVDKELKMIWEAGKRKELRDYIIEW
jgi:hypothetical protein